MSDSKLENTYSNPTARSPTFWQEVSKIFSFTSHAEIKYCTVETDSNVYKYFCYKHEVCCKSGNGCCPQNASNKYLESWAFWTCILFVIITIYLLCWYCKKLEKLRHARALHLAHQQGRNRSVLMPQRQSQVNSNCCSNNSDREQSRGTSSSVSSRRPNRCTVDRLLENLIRDYRSRLGTDEPPLDNLPTHPTVPPKNNLRESPPKYVDALNMPRPHRKPQRPSASGRSENGPTASHSGRSGTDEGPVDRRNFVIIEINGEQTVPTYEEATRARFV